MAIKILTDSSSDLPLDYIKANDIEVLPLKVIFGNQSYDSGVNLSTAEFYEKLAQATELPKTSQVAPAEIQACLEKYAASDDELIAIFISSRMSGTYHTACNILEDLKADNIYIVDSQTVTFALAALVMEAVRLRDMGLSAKEIYETLEQVKNDIALYAVIGDLKYLQMGGRLSTTAAFIGSMLNFKPIITIKDGLVAVIDKQRGSLRAYKSIMSYVENAGIDLTRPRTFGHTNCPELMNELIDHFAKAFPDIDTNTFARCDIGSTVGVHVGPGSAGLAFFRKK
ncbi:MAG TPA: DegV family protein [Clostridiales bacterium]|nr:DegV family protein [Clostridiales bacterium]